jgi:hypothetical protein
MKSGNLNFLEPSGLIQACNGSAFTNEQEWLSDWEIEAVHKLRRSFLKQDSLHCLCQVKKSNVISTINNVYLKSTVFWEKSSRILPDRMTKTLEIGINEFLIWFENFTLYVQAGY